MVAIPHIYHLLPAVLMGGGESETLRTVFRTLRDVSQASHPSVVCRWTEETQRVAVSHRCGFISTRRLGFA